MWWYRNISHTNPCQRFSWGFRTPGYIGYSLWWRLKTALDSARWTGKGADAPLATQWQGYHLVRLEVSEACEFSFYPGVSKLWCISEDLAGLSLRVSDSLGHRWAFKLVFLIKILVVLILCSRTTPWELLHSTDLDDPVTIQKVEILNIVFSYDVYLC